MDVETDILVAEFRADGFDDRALIENLLFRECLRAYGRGELGLPGLRRVADNLAIFNPKLRPNKPKE